MKVAVIGTGYVGLVTGACLAEIGHHVTCLDIDAAKIARLCRGEIPIYEPYLEELVRRCVESGRLGFTTSYAEAMPESHVVMLAVGTPSGADGSADLSYFFAAAEDVARYLTGYAVIVAKSTVPVGTSERLAERVASLYAGEFDVVSNPEFLREGRAVNDCSRPERIVIGSRSERAANIILEMYEPFECRKLVMSPRSAELTKYASNAFLATKVSFINEVAHLAEELGADVEEVAAGIGSDPRIGPQFLHAGLGWGGSCFPKDVRELMHVAESLGTSLPIIEAANLMNERARLRIVSRLESALCGLEGKHIGLLGLSFKKNTDDTRESAALALLQHLHSAKARVIAYDPAARVHEQYHSMFERVEDAYAAAKGCHAVIVATDWDVFRDLDLARLKSLMAGDLLLDARNLLSQSDAQAAGFRYLRVGRR